MTKEDLKALATKWATDPGAPDPDLEEHAGKLAVGYLALLAQEEARGEVVGACPDCARLLGIPEQGHAEGWCNFCEVQWHRDLIEWLQRIPKPEAAD